MKVVQVSSSAQIGGAGIAAHRLHTGLRNLGADSMMLVDKALDTDPYVVIPGNSYDKLLARVCPILDRVPGCFLRPELDRVSSSWFPNRLLSRVKALQADILNLHWVNDGFMRIETLGSFDRPIVWTFHDMWPFAGGEHYVGGSVRYKEGYSRTNRPAVESGFDVNRWVWNRKRRSWKTLQNNLVIATPSRWLADCVRQSILFRDFRIEVLPNGIDHERFKPMRRDIVRDILGLPKDRKLILFAAGSATTDKRKGYHLLIDALQHLQSMGQYDEYELVVFGAASGIDSFRMKTRYLGKLHDEISMALVYAAADVFLAPSLEDNLPNTVLESLACGTPVAAFNIGGMPDMIAHRHNGYLAAPYDTAELAHGLQWIVDKQARWEQLSEKARATVLDGFTLELAARRYLDLYEEILDVARK